MRCFSTLPCLVQQSAATDKHPETHSCTITTYPDIQITVF